MSARKPGSALAVHGRYDYAPITLRPGFRWPNGARLAIYFALGLEQYDFGAGMTENLVPGMSAPDVLNTSWRSTASLSTSCRSRYFSTAPCASTRRRWSRPALVPTASSLPTAIPIRTRSAA